ncbi:MAG: hypothetical protein IIC87_05740 [Chloroflexi bacterium]|nr:hypothetical protein [Chloroflexota bacterium]
MAMNEMLFGGRAVLTEAVPTGMQKMAAKMWAPMLVMGLMVIVAALIFSIVKANFVSDYFAVPKEIRDGANATLIDKRQFIEFANVWLPGLQLLGIGLILSAITFSLANILGVFRTGGVQIQKAFGNEPQTLTPPITAKLFPMFMMMGLMILIANLIIAVIIGATAWDVYGHSVAEINAAESGSGLLSDLGTVESFKMWLAPFKFVGLATILVGISMAVHTILQVIRFQGQRIRELAAGR